MKLLIRDYLASLKEREELDAVLPDLLSEMGFNVYSRPRRGTVQHGVDIAAVGDDDDGERKVFLFSVKQGDLSREDWDGTPQALRPSLNEIVDVYIRNRIPKRYSNLKIVICLAFGGEVREQVRDSLTGYINANTTDTISFDEWNGDKIAGLILDGVLREEILPKAMRSSFQKSVAMVDRPDVSYDHFSRLLHDLLVAGKKSLKAGVRTARQINICLWILFVWSRDIDNYDAAYRSSELALLIGWELERKHLGKKSRDEKALERVIQQLAETHLTIISDFIDTKILDFVNVRDGLSYSVRTQSSLDVNLALFETLGKISLAGLWFHWLSNINGVEDDSPARLAVKRYTLAGINLIHNNPTLLLPVADEQGTDIVLFLMLWLVSGESPDGIISWLREMVNRFDLTVRTRELYTTSYSDYHELSRHPRDNSDEYFQDSTGGSTVIPIVAAWLSALNQDDSVEQLRKLVEEKLQHCTLQLWLPDSESEEKIYTGSSSHGIALCDLSLAEGGESLITTIKEACSRYEGFNYLSANTTGLWPIILVACRHSRLPVPPNFWISFLAPGEVGEPDA